MNVTVKCLKCEEPIEITKEIAHFIGSDLQLIYDDLYNAIKVMHRNCDPTDMTLDDATVWHKWDRVFNPENYD